MPARESRRWRPPRGPHRLPREMIAGSQREWLLEAAMRVVAEKGYAAATVADLTREARVSRTTFYEQFADKEACFLAAYDSATEIAIKRITKAYEGQERWPEQVGAGLAALLETLAAEPALARLGLLGVSAAGPAAQRRYRLALGRLTPLFEEGRDFAPQGRQLPANTSRMAIGAVAGLIAEELRAGRAAELPGLLGEVLLAALSPYLGQEAATREASQVTKTVMYVKG